MLLTRVCQAQGDNAAARDAALRGLERHPGHRRLVELSRVRVGDETLSGFAAQEAEARAEEPTATAVAIFDEDAGEPEDDDDTPASPPLEPEEGATERAAFAPPPLPPDLSTSGEGTAEQALPATSPLRAAPGSDPGATVPGVLRPSRLARRAHVVEASDRHDQPEPEEDPSASGMTPMPSDELGFDAREKAGAQSAPDLVSAVRSLIGDEPPEDDEPRTPRRPLFASLLEVGSPASPTLADPEGVGGPTPPATPAALLKLRGEGARKGPLSPSPVEAATVPLTAREGSKVARRIGGELRAPDSPAPEPTMPSPQGPRIVIQPELHHRSSRSSDAPTRVKADEPSAPATTPAATPRPVTRTAAARRA